MSSLRRGHANLLCIVPILSDDPRRVAPPASFSTMAPARSSAMFEIYTRNCAETSVSSFVIACADGRSRGEHVQREMLERATHLHQRPLAPGCDRNFSSNNSRTIYVSSLCVTIAAAYLWSCIALSAIPAQELGSLGYASMPKIYNDKAVVLGENDVARLQVPVDCSA